MDTLTVHQLKALFPKTDPAAIEEFFHAVRDFEEDATDDNFTALLHMMTQAHPQGKRGVPHVRHLGHSELGKNQVMRKSLSQKPLFGFHF